MTLPAERLGLSAAEFNSERGMAAGDVSAIMEMARAEGVSVIDTAAVYGDSESVLARSLEFTDEFRIVTKVPPLREPAIGSRQIDIVKRAFARSLRRLSVPRVDGLLVHHAHDLLADGGEWLWEVLVEFQERGLTDRIGVAVDNEQQLSAIWEAFDIDIVQLPLNIFDQRFLVSGLVDQLQRAGIEVHARSPFCGGVLCSSPDELPASCATVAPLLKRYHQFRLKHNLTMLKAALGFVLSTSVDHVLVRPKGLDEFDRIIAATGSLPAGLPDFSDFACQDEALIGPTLWAA